MPRIQVGDISLNYIDRAAGRQPQADHQGRAPLGQQRVQAWQRGVEESGFAPIAETGCISGTSHVPTHS